MYSFIGLFFFSSRRRHTRSLRDWSSDVCSSDLTILLWVYYVSNILTLPAEYGYVGVILITAFTYTLLRLRFLRSEERREGKSVDLGGRRIIKKKKKSRERNNKFK